MRISDLSSDVCSSDLIGIVVFLIVGCLLVLRPFLAAILFAAIICVFTWPWYQKLWSRLGEHDTWAAFVMTLLLLIALLLPVALDRKSDVEGTTVSVRVDLGVRRIINKNIIINN